MEAAGADQGVDRVAPASSRSPGGRGGADVDDRAIGGQHDLVAGRVGPGLDQVAARGGRAAEGNLVRRDLAEERDHARHAGEDNIRPVLPGLQLAAGTDPIGVVRAPGGAAAGPRQGQGVDGKCVEGKTGLHALQGVEPHVLPAAGKPCQKLHAALAGRRAVDRGPGTVVAGDLDLVGLGIRGPPTELDLIDRRDRAEIDRERLRPARPARPCGARVGVDGVGPGGDARLGRGDAHGGVQGHVVREVGREGHVVEGGGAWRAARVARDRQPCQVTAVAEVQADGTDFGPGAAVVRIVACIETAALHQHHPDGVRCGGGGVRRGYATYWIY